MKSLHSFKGVIDTTFRDGQQSPLMFDTHKYRFLLEDKKILAKGLIELGVDKFEFFSPVVSEVEREDFKKLSKYMKSIRPDIMLLAHCRCHPSDIREAINAGFDGLNFYIGIAEHSQKFSHGMDAKTIGKNVSTLLSDVHKKHPNLYLRFSAEDCFRTSLEDIFEIYDLVAPFVQTFGMPDTVGIANPEMVRERVLALKKRYPNLDIECHFHNDRGYSLVNAISGIQSGASYVDTTIWGMAERSGITSVTGLLFNLFHESRESCEKFNLKLCYPINVLMGSILKFQVPTSEPISLTNRTHTAGVHQKAVLKSNSVYEGVDLAQFGVSSKQLLLGPLSGWNLIYYYLREVKFYDVTHDLAKVIARDFKQKISKIGNVYSPENLLEDIMKSYKAKKLPVEGEILTARFEHLVESINH